MDDLLHENRDFVFAKHANDDLVHLNNLDEATVLNELKKRFNKNQIYVS
jgi:myosin heavy subunit